MKKTCLLFLLFAAISFNALHAQQVIFSSKPGWYKIADKSVDFKTDRDAITIAGADKFKAIQLRVTDSRIHFEDFDVVYNLPGISQEFKEDISIRRDFKPGERTRIIYLKYPCLKIDKVVFVYRTVANWKSDKAHVEVYGLK